MSDRTSPPRLPDIAWQGDVHRLFNEVWVEEVGRPACRLRRDFNRLRRAYQLLVEAAGEAWPEALVWTTRHYLDLAVGLPSLGNWTLQLPVYLEDWALRRSPPAPFQVRRPVPVDALLPVDGVPGVDAFHPRER